MRLELSSLVKFLSLGVDTLAKSVDTYDSTAAAAASTKQETIRLGGDVRDTWSILSFALEDWRD